MIAAAQFWPGLSPLRPLPGGARAKVWLAEDSRGGQWVLKTTLHSEPALDWLAPVQAAARQAGFVVPGLVRSPSGLWAPGGVSCEPFVPGLPAGPADLPAPFAPISAPRLRAFHAKAQALPPRPGLPGLALATALATDLPADLPAPLAADLRAALAPMAGADIGTVHGDLNPGNVILTKDGPALIDWDEARRDALFLDEIATRPPSDAESLAALAVEILACWAPEPARARSLAKTLAGRLSPRPKARLGRSGASDGA